MIEAADAFLDIFITRSGGAKLQSIDERVVKMKHRLISTSREDTQ